MKFRQNSEVFLLRLQKCLETSESFQKKVSPKISSGHLKCSFDKPAMVFCSKSQFFFSNSGKKWKIRKKRRKAVSSKMSSGDAEKSVDQPVKSLTELEKFLNSNSVNRIFSSKKDNLTQKLIWTHVICNFRNRRNAIWH